MVSITGYDVRGAPLQSLGNIKTLRIVGDLASPAVQCRVELLPRRGRGEVGRVQVHQGKKVLFSGVVDQQRRIHSDEGEVLLLEARSGGAAFLDNEALPGSLWGANLTTIFMRHLAPHGFTLFQSQSGQQLPVFSIHKGMSLWDVFSRFSKRLYGLTPFVRGTQVFVKPLSWREEIVVSNRGKGHLFVSLEAIDTPYEILSDIVLRDEEGYYSTKVSNPLAPRIGIKRRRYHIPATEFVDHPRLDAHQRIKASMYQSRQWTVVIPKLISVEVGMGVRISDSLLDKSGLIVDRWQYDCSEQGNFTTLSLRDSSYW